jgi:hypothetical protein
MVVCPASRAQRPKGSLPGWPSPRPSGPWRPALAGTPGALLSRSPRTERARRRGCRRRSGGRGGICCPARTLTGGGACADDESEAGAHRRGGSMGGRRCGNVPRRRRPPVGVGGRGEFLQDREMEVGVRRWPIEEEIRGGRCSGPACAKLRRGNGAARHGGGWRGALRRGEATG